VEAGTVNGLTLKNVKTGEVSRYETQGLFIAIGHVPNTQMVKGQITLDDNGYIQTVAGTTTTNIPGVFAAGDVQDHVYRQAVTAAGTGCMAAIEAERWLAQNEHI
ncbi:MAG TPA: FAD-dependent oxidoreductase, partial [Polyangiales bacterium]